MKPSNADSQFIQIIKDATSAPSSHNTQPWKFKIDMNKYELISPTRNRFLLINKMNS